jgi:cysteine desulfurase/selenocysteine lyase
MEEGRMIGEEVRERAFPSLEGRAYLNTAAEGIPPQCVAEALAEYACDKQLGMDGRLRHEAQWRGLREAAGQLFGLSAEEIGICSCSSEAFNLAAMALRLEDGDEVVITDLDFPAGATPWLQEVCPATVRLWKAREGALQVEDLVPLLGPKTRLVTVSLVSFFNGFMLPLQEVIATVRQRSDALVAVDVTQAAGRVPLRLDDADLIVSSTHKWLLGSHGGGLVGVPKARAADWTVPAGGWFNLANAFEADRFERAVTKPGAESFSVGMPNYPAVYAVNAAVRYVLGVGVEAIHSHAQPLTQACLDGVAEADVDLLTPRKPKHLAGILAFRHPKAEAIHRFLHDRDIHIMAHAGRLRVAVHGYNTAGDIERLLAGLQDALQAV